MPTAPEVVLTQAPLELIRLIKEAQRRDGRHWEEIVVAAGLRLKTVEGWLNGNIKSPPLIGMAKLTQQLGIPPERVFEAAQTSVEQLRELVREIDEELARDGEPLGEAPEGNSGRDSSSESPEDEPRPRL